MRTTGNAMVALGLSGKMLASAIRTLSSPWTPHEAALVTEMFRRYADDGATIADLGRWLTSQGAATRTGKERWDRPVIWGMLRNPAYAGTAVFGKTRVIHEPAGLNRTAASPAAPSPGRSASRTGPGRNGRASPSPPWWMRRPSTGRSSDWPATSGSPHGTRGSRRCCRASPPARPAATTAAPRPLPRGTRSAITGTSAPMTAATRADAATRTSRPRRLRQPGRLELRHRPARRPALIRAEIGKRLERARTSDPVTGKRDQLEQALAMAPIGLQGQVRSLPDPLASVGAIAPYQVPALRSARSMRVTLTRGLTPRPDVV
jgi:site-specific DNA recombinase